MFKSKSNYTFYTGYFDRPETHHAGRFRIFRGNHRDGWVKEIWFGKRYIHITKDKMYV